MKEISAVQKILAAALVVLGLAGLVLGRLGETTWAPSTEHTAVADLADAGPAVVIDPGVLYVGGEEGTVEITAASDVSVITAANDDIAAYLAQTRYTRVTGVPSWETLSTEVVNPDGGTTLSDPAGSDLWRQVETSPSPASIDIAAFRREEAAPGSEQPYRAILLVTDGTAPGAQSISITWPVEASNAWVPYAYAGGATVAVIGLIWFVLAFRSSGRRDEDHAPARPEVAAAAAGPSAAPSTTTAAPTLVPGRDAPVSSPDSAPPAGDVTDTLPPVPAAEEDPAPRAPHRPTHRGEERS
ncbi:hypothetical protein [Brachybacterium phenoliresistens]|uniref:hypothetical protein n=1 Tax=Brachybacterium phenoliresistens TaxID=396014 RepID=UPI0012EC9991|nr:hypothetical protein [Brachybacterium phenoliresistens]